MKKTRYESGMIVTTDDLDFDSRALARSIEQTRYDLLEDQGTRVKGIVRNSGMTTGHFADPLKVYKVGTTISIYSGVAYDSYEGVSNRIWVPNDPSDVPVNPAHAVANHDNIDMIDEVQTKDIATASRPPRTNLKTFSAADAQGSWYVCIRFAYGDYDYIPIPSDGHMAFSKRYESYVIEVSQSTAAQLFVSTGYPWIQLATLNWDGTTVWIEADDRVFTSCVVTVTEEQVRLHQDRFHGNAIVSEDRTKLSLTIVPPDQMTIGNYAFSGNDGMHINGYFLQTVNNTILNFDATYAVGLYYFYIDAEGTFRATTAFGTANTHLILGSCHWTGAQLQRSATDTTQVAYDRRQFGAIGRYDISQRIVGENFTYTDDLTLEYASDELRRHRGYTHGNALVRDLGAAPLAYTSLADGSLGCTFAADSVTVKPINPDDILLIDTFVGSHGYMGNELRTLYPPGGSPVTIPGAAGYYLLYAVRAAAAPDPLHSYSLGIRSFSGSISSHEYPICSFHATGGSADSSIRDRRIYGTIGYAHIQRNWNSSGNNNLPQLLTCIWGLTQTVVAGTDSDVIYMTHNWGSVAATGGGSAPGAGGRPVFAVKPLIMVYTLSGGSYGGFNFGSYVDGGNDYGYYLSEVSNVSFTIHNAGFHVDPDREFYWIAIGPPYENSGAVIEGRNNPNYSEYLT